MKKKTISLLLSLSLFAGLMAGCGDNGGNAGTKETAGTSETQDSGSKTVTMMSWYSEEEMKCQRHHWHRADRWVQRRRAVPLLFGRQKLWHPLLWVVCRDILQQNPL